MSFSVGTGAVPGDEFVEALHKLADKIPESQYARDECVALVQDAARVAARMFEESLLGAKDVGGWSLNVSGHSNPAHQVEGTYSADEFVSIGFSHHSPNSMEYLAKQKSS